MEASTSNFHILLEFPLSTQVKPGSASGNVCRRRHFKFKFFKMSMIMALLCSRRVLNPAPRGWICFGDTTVIILVTQRHNFGTTIQGFPTFLVTQYTILVTHPGAPQLWQQNQPLPKRISGYTFVKGAFFGGVSLALSMYVATQITSQSLSLLFSYSLFPPTFFQDQDACPWRRRSRGTDTGQG